MRLLKQKKMYETQKDQLMQQSMNLEQTHFMAQSMQDTIATVRTRKSCARSRAQPALRGRAVLAAR